MRALRLTSPRTAYIVGLALIAFMVLCQFAGTKLLSSKQEVSALEINLSGRQRMLSQRIALEVKRLSLDTQLSTEDVARTRAIILHCTQLMEASHAALVKRDPDGMRQVLSSGQDCVRPASTVPMPVAKAPLQIVGAPILEQFTSTARAVALDEIARDEIELNFVSDPTLTALLMQLNEVTFTAQEVSIQQIRAFVTFGWILLFVLIVGEVVFIFQPMARSVDASIKKLRDSNQKLSESEKSLQDFASTGAHRFWETDTDHRINRVVPAGPEHVVVEQQLFLGKRQWEVSVQDTSDGDVDWAAHKATLEAKRPFRNFEYPVQRPDGTVLWWRTHGTPVFNIEGEFEGYRGTALDITEAKKAEEVSQQSERMSSLGQLTAGVAHDFNNLLSVIRGNAELIEIDLDPQERAINVREIVAAVERGASLTERLLAFGRVQKLKAEPVEIGAFFRDMSDLLNRTLGEDFSIQAIPPAKPLYINVDRHRLQDAFVNLASNARDACGAGGHLVIEASIHSRAVHMPMSDQNFGAGEFVCIAFKDNGSGIPLAELGRIFEPFFTTKPVGAGSGLGLSMVYGFALQSEGFVDVTSTQGQGTQVSLFLPKTANTGPVLQESAKSKHPFVVGGQRVLLMEDNYAFRRIARKMLESLGLDVVEADDAASALAELELQGPFDLLVADVLLPGTMNGIEAARAAQTIQPGLAVLFSSGFLGTEANISEFGEIPGPLLRKPYSQKELAEKVAQVLGVFVGLRASD